jgi:hypothetical protein
MASRSREIYQRRGPFRLILKILFGLVLSAVLLAVVVFFWFQSYIVYTPDGVRLDIPFLNRGEVTQITEEAPGD